MTLVHFFLNFNNWKSSSAPQDDKLHEGRFMTRLILCYLPVTLQNVQELVFTQYQFGEGDGTPLQYSCLENPTDGVWWVAVHGIAKSRTWLSDFTFTFHFHALEKEMVTHSSILA